MVEPLFSEHRIKAMQPYIQKTVDTLLSAMIEKRQPGRRIDLVQEFALPVPPYIIYTILGVPFEDLEFLTAQNAIRTNGSATAREAASANQWVSLVLSFVLVPQLTELSRDLLDYLAKLVDLRLETPKDDLISKLAVEQLRVGHIQKSDVVAIAFLLLVAGNATMVNMIALVSIRCGILGTQTCDPLLIATRVLSLCSRILISWPS